MNIQVPRRSDGTIQKARVKQPWPKDRLFKILSIDGGGIRGVFPAAYLAEIERRFLGGAPVSGYFDMISGTSTGGIIALALVSELTAAQALAIYSERGERIFPRKTGVGKIAQIARWLTGPKHDPSLLRKELDEVFGDRPLDDATNRLVIPSFEGLHGEPFLYKTPHHPDYQLDRHKKMVEVALHTSAAPTFFPAVEDNGHIMLDGGLWANNPVMNALVDALACYDVPRENVRILSIGTGESTFTVEQAARQGGIRHWVFLRAFETASRAQSRNALGQAYLLVGKNNVLRIDVSESDNPIELDDVRRSLKELPLVARSLVEGSGHHVENMFLHQRATRFEKREHA